MTKSSIPVTPLAVDPAQQAQLKAALQVGVVGGGNHRGHHPWLAEQGANVVTQDGLVVLNGQNVVAALANDHVNDRLLSQLGIAGDDPTLKIEPLQKRQGRADLVTIVDGTLRQHNPHLGDEGRQEVLGLLAAVPTARLRLAVPRQWPEGRQSDLPPLAQRLLQSSHILRVGFRRTAGSPPRSGLRTTELTDDLR